MGFEVEITDLRDSAKAAREAADDANKVEPGDALLKAKPALPGSQSADKLADAAKHLDGHLRGWVKDARAFAKTLDGNADRYSSDDKAASDAFWKKLPPKGLHR